MSKMSWDVAEDAVNYKGKPADKGTTGGWIPAALILGIEVCERLSTLGISVNLVTYLGGTMHMPSAAAANTVTDYLGTSFLLCLLGGFLADAFLGRYKTIAVFTIVQIIGTGALAIAAKLPELRPPPCEANGYCKPANEVQMGVLYIALYLIALGTGGLKSCVSGFGTDQFDDKDEKEKAQMDYFFGRFFFLISIGTLAGVTVLVYLEDHVSRSLGYGICTVSMTIAVMLFFSGTKRYRYKRSTGSPIVQIMQVIAAAIRKNKMNVPSDISLLYENTPEPARIQHTEQFSFLDKAAVVEKEDFMDRALSAPNPWKLCTVTRVEEVKMMAKLIPIWATTIIFWTAYAQMITFSVQQASTMDRKVGSFEIPSGSMAVFFVIAILITLAIYDRLVIPVWKKWKGKPGFSNLQRMGIGLLVSSFGMGAAGLVEMKRLSVAKSIGQGSTSALPVSAFLLVPQFFLVGSAEAFIYTGQLDFFITNAPKGMKSMSTGLFLTTLSLGFFFSSLLVSIVKKATVSSNGGHGWLADNINYGRLDLFYAVLAILGIVNFGLYIICAVSFKSHKPKPSPAAVNGGAGEEKC